MVISGEQHRRTDADYSALARSGPPVHVLRDYALIADGERGALIGPRGDLSWLCVPRWDSDAVFATLLGGRGCYTVAPTGRYVWGGYYEPGTLIWHSHWVVGASVVECRDALALPADSHRAVVLRRITAVRGEAEVLATLEPATAFGREPLADITRDAEGVWCAQHGGMRMRWSGAAWAKVDRSGRFSRLSQRIHLAEGDFHDLILEVSDAPLPGERLDAETLWQATTSEWGRAVPPIGRNATAADTAQAYAVMRGLTSAGGGMVAAATTSLPEHANRGENYDYRYVWIRDQCYAGLAVAADGPHELLSSATRFVSERLLDDGPNLQPAYTVAGGRVPGIRDIGLPGYPGATSLFGNRVRDQFQLDIFGEALLLFAAAARYDLLTDQHRRAIALAVSAIRDRRDDPDAGIWELGAHRWTHSRLICAAGLRAVAGQRASGVDADSCGRLAETILAETTRTSLHPSGRWQQAPDLPDMDAALVLPAVRGALPARDARSLATFRAAERDLSRDYFVYRYQHSDLAGPLYAAEGAFLMCGFAMSLGALRLGEKSTAWRYFERNRTACGTPGLFAEEFDIRQRQLRGNLPQAFVHALMFEASVRLAEVDPGACPRE
ncbi:glycoside hydrolase family 15 protein [Nocardia sp. NBC_01503]|uniref:glycoside hydrolase family 15 protein n=1 Tax=Nocardia sp. NBC_01503 TaxID=2975997 RepID=UPI002E7BAA86|nr:glycoside hydrolase family 15 protein [Nocardia sp. NBC_01503]WTL31013.1 glycoside hydrolase family 15 protein [Nocardia sp. NBC_01503]